MGIGEEAYQFFTSLLSSNKNRKSNHNDEAINISPDIVIKAKEGDTLAQLELGKAYFNAPLVENNLEEAFRCISLSVEQGNIEAQFRLGNLYALGCGTEKSLSDAYKWYTKAAIQGYKKALVRIYNLYQEDIKMHCRGQLNSEEEEWASEEYKKKKKIRELYEYRLEQNKFILNGAIDYYTHQFKFYQVQNQEDQTVQLNLAFLYQHGYGVKKCVRWAFEYYELAANQGNTDAQYNLGSLYQKHTDKKFNYRHAFKWYTKSAQGGSISAQRCLAYFYLKGLATDIDYDTAIFWYTKAANAGDSEAQVTLGKLYRKGDYVKQDLSIAVKWYSLAARQGNKVAQNCLSQLHQRGMLFGIELEDDILEYLTKESMEKRLCSKLSMDISKLGDLPKLKQLNKLAKCACIGDGPAMYEIGLYYYNGENGFTQDKDTGIKWIKNAANAKHKDAQFTLADLYKKGGDSIEQDYRKAYIWYKELAKKKDSQAQCNVGVMYDEGLGVRNDPLEASKWFTWAADQGNSDAQYKLGMLRYNGRGLRQDEENAAEWLYKSTCQRNIQACYQLGFFYFYGRAGLQSNIEYGLILLEFAAKGGQIDAQKLLGNEFLTGYPVKKDINKSIEYYTMAANLGDAKAPYQMAIIYLIEDGINGNYMKVYDLFKKARDRGHEDAKLVFETPMKLDYEKTFYSKVLRMLTKATEKGIDDLSYSIGYFYWHGLNCRDDQVNQKDYVKAEKWLLVASKRGDSRADFLLGTMYEYGEGVEANLVTAVYYFLRAVERENRDAMYKLACMYLNGYGVAQDFLRAFYFFSRASTLGYRKATEVLTVFRNDDRIGSGFDKDREITLNRETRIHMLEKATEKGHARLQYQLGLIYEQNNEYSKAFKWLALATKLGITDAYYRVGIFYEEGKGTKQNYSAAVNMYQYAAEKDHEDACYRLGRLYQYGSGVELNYVKAYGLYKKSAEMGHENASRVLNITLETKVQFNRDVQKYFFDVSSKEYQDSLTMYKCVAKHGNIEAQFKVGVAYEYSYSEPNYAEAFKWYSMAAKNSHKEAMYHLGLLFEHGLGVSQDYHEAIQLYEQAYQLGSDDALFRFAIAYHHGKGVDIDTTKAIEYYTLSAELGNPEYQCELGRLYEEGELVQRDLLRALKWYTTAYAQGYDNIRSKLCSMYDDNKPYEKFIYEKLVRNLSVASHNYFGLNKNYFYEEYGKINKRLGVFHVLGLGTKKDLKIAFEYFSKKYSNSYSKKDLIKLIHISSGFDFLLDDNLSASLRNDLLNEFEKDEAFIKQLSSEKLHLLGMIYYDGIVKTQGVSEDNEEKGYAPIDDQDLNDPSQYILIEKNHLKAFKYLKMAADKKYYKAMEEPVLLYYTPDIQKDSLEFKQYTVSETNNRIIILDNNAGRNQRHNFSKAVEWYSYLEKTLTEDKKMPENARKTINEHTQLGWGYLYEYGYGVKQDYEKAMEYYKILADNNHPMGYFRLALMHYYGKGVSIDYKEALELFEKAKSGHFWSYNTVFMYDQNDLHTSDSEKAKMYCVKKNYEVKVESYYYLGLMHKYGQGVSKDDDEAQNYFMDALKGGCKQAINEVVF